MYPIRDTGGVVSFGKPSEKPFRLYIPAPFWKFTSLADYTRIYCTFTILSVVPQFNPNRKFGSPKRTSVSSCRTCLLMHSMTVVSILFLFVEFMVVMNGPSKKEPRLFVVFLDVEPKVQQRS
jgi:hypothetical protein